MLIVPNSSAVEKGSHVETLWRVIAVEESAQGASSLAELSSRILCPPSTDISLPHIILLFPPCLATTPFESFRHDPFITLSCTIANELVYYWDRSRVCAI